MKYRWMIVLGCGTGLIVSISPLFYNTLPVFLRSISADTGWGRAQVISGVSICTAVSMLTSPMVGRMVDLFGPRRVIAYTAIPFGMSILGMKFVGSNYLAYLGLAVLIGFFGNCANTFVYLSFMPRWFDRRLGLSLGLTATGIGVGQSLSPLIASALQGWVGWRDGYAFLGLGAIAITLLCALLVLRDNPPETGSFQMAVPDPDDGMTLRSAMRTAEFWRLGVSILLVTAAVTGCILNMVPMLVDGGVAPTVAARLAAITGVSVIVGRLGTGLVLDAVPASTIAAILFSAPILSLVLLCASNAIGSYAVAIAVLGLALGAEGDVMAYMVRRAFGTRSYGEIYGWLWGAFSCGTLIGPLVMGASFDLLGSYRPMIVVLGLCTLTAAILVPRIDAVRQRWQPA